MRFFTTLFILLSLTLSLNAGDKEDKIKGVILERISQFITYNDSSEEFVICVYDDPSLTKLFTKLFDGRQYKNRDIKITGVESTNELKSCNVLYVQDISNSTAKEIIKNSQKQMLLVTQDVDNVYDGFMIAMYFENKKIKFVVNHEAITKADLKVNYRLLKVATKVINPVRN